VIVLGLALLAVLFVGGARFLLSQAYFVGLDGEDVVIYQGVNLEIGPFDLARVVERTGHTVDDVVPWYARQLEDGRPADSLEDARAIVRGMPLRETDETSGGDESAGGGDSTEDATGAEADGDG
jgi:PPM family protein phosphatase